MSGNEVSRWRLTMRRVASIDGRSDLRCCLTDGERLSLSVGLGCVPCPSNSPAKVGGDAPAKYSHVYAMSGISTCPQGNQDEYRNLEEKMLLASFYWAMAYLTAATGGL